MVTIQIVDYILYSFYGISTCIYAWIPIVHDEQIITMKQNNIIIRICPYSSIYSIYLVGAVIVAYC